MRPLALALALVAVPAVAQSAPEAPPTEWASVDPVIVGEWALDEVVAAGQLGAYDVTLEDMTCAFEAEGEAHVVMALVQDGDPMAQTRAFSFVTDRGRIVVPDDEDVTYRLLDDGRLELVAEGGLIVRLARSGG